MEDFLWVLSIVFLLASGYYWLSAAARYESKQNAIYFALLAIFLRVTVLAYQLQ